MEVNADNYQVLAKYLESTLSPDPNVRRPAEKFLETVETNQNYPILLLNLIEKEDAGLTVRVAGAITFKNYVKRNWGSGEDGEPNKIHETDRGAVKSFIVPLMLKSPLAIQKQLSDAISIIGKHDFPKKWPQMIDEMIEKFATGDFHIINGVLQTAHSLFKRYRFEFKSQALWEEIKFVLDRLAQPLTELLNATMGLAQAHADNGDALKVIYGSLVLICKVFYSLNSQDLPEFFEDNMKIWMPAFHQLLTAKVPALQTPDNEEAGVLEQLKSQICDNLCLYAKMYDEEFHDYMQQFVTAVWELLVGTGNQTKYDALVSNALQFLSTVAERNHYRQLFEDPSVLASICQNVIIPNMDFRTSDEELFEDNPEEYIRRDIEGSDIDTRRRAACDLVKTLSQNFEAKIIEIFGQYLEVLLGKYAENPAANWKSKDTAIYLVMALATRGSTQKMGVTQASQLVPLPSFCLQQIIPELQKPNINELPVLRADALKFIMTFRSLLGQEIILAALPHMIRHLKVQSIVVHSYAACTLEKVLVLKIAKESMVTDTHLTPYGAELFEGLFNVLSQPGSTENEYVMKAIMRSFSTLQSASIPYMANALTALTKILNDVAKNPSKPHFNHYLFETFSISIKIVCQTNFQAVDAFETALFPVFQGILQQDVLEFMPYVFQILSLLLEVREGKSEVPSSYLALFPCLLAPPLYERPGNVTPLIRLLCAFVRQASPNISKEGKLNAVLGVFQKMMSSKANDHEGFYLLQNLIQHYPMSELQANMKQVFQIFFTRLSGSKTTKFVKSFIVFVSFYAAKVGTQQLVELVDSIQGQLFGMVIGRVFVIDMNKVSGETDHKIVCVGTTLILCETPQMLSAEYVELWPQLLQALIQMYEQPPDDSNIDGDNFIDIEDTAGYEVAYSQLNFAQSKKSDPIPEVMDTKKFLVENLGKLSQSRPGQIPGLISRMQMQHQEALQKYCAQYGVRIA